MYGSFLIARPSELEVQERPLRSGHEEEEGGGFIWHFSRDGKEAVFRTPPQRLPNPRRATTLSNAYKTMQTYCQEKKLPLEPLERFDYFQKKLLSRDKKGTPETEFYRELETQIIEAQNRMTGRNYGCKE